MTSGQALALALAGGVGALGVSLTVAIAGPTKPTPSRPTGRRANGKATGARR